jgi:predicted Rossmann fold flavoprotein
MKIYNNIIIGAGASGLMFGANLKNKKDTLIVETNSNAGAKILISGGGRCNFTNKNISSKYYLAKQNFLNRLFKEFSDSIILDYFKNRGLEYIIKNNQYFCKNSAKELLDILLKETKDIEFLFNTKVLEVLKKDDIFEIRTNKNALYTKNLIVASGGLSYPKIGASLIGFDIAKSFGHKINTLKPALVGFTIQPSESFFKELSGVSVEVSLNLYKKILDGSMLFAHKGVSGPVILNASLFWEKGHIFIDFLPHFDIDSLKNSTKSISNSLPLPKRVANALLDKLKIKNTQASKIDSKDFTKLAELKSYKFAPSGTFGYSKAEVTKGGIDIDEINNLTFESKIVKNLYFLGEVLDVTGMLGGYNFHFAFLSAISCAKSFNNN